MDIKAIERHLNIIGNRKTYCIFGGKQEWDEKAKLYRLPKSSRDKATEWVLKDKIVDVLNEYYNKKWTVWISLNDKETGDDTTKGVKSISVFWFDFDAPRANKAEPATDEEREQAFEEAKKFKAGMQKTFDVMGFIACSGNGYHLFYPVEQYPLLGKSFRKEVNEKQRIFFKKLREKSNIKFDTTTDIRRVTQPIGGLNYKIPDKPIKTHWIDNPTDKEIEEARKKNLSLLTAVLDTKIEEETHHAAVAKDHPKFSEILERDTKLKELYVGEWRKYDFKSRSEAEQSLVTILCMSKFADDEIKEIMKGCKIGKWEEREEAYYNATIKKGREFATSHPKPESVESEGKRHGTEYHHNVFFRDDEGRKKVNHEMLISNIFNEYNFKTFEDTEELLVFDGGIYRNGVTRVKAYLENTLGSFTNKHLVSEIIGHIQRGTYTPRENFNNGFHYIPVSNGLLDLNTQQLEKFDPTKLYTFRIPTDYDPNAGYSHIEAFFKEVLHAEDIKTMQEIFGYVLYMGYPAHKAMWWLGAGRNGKTTAGSLLTALVGTENTAGVPLSQLDGGHRFAVARLFGKLVNIVAEPETKSAMQTPTFKAATGGDTIFGEWKNVQDDFPFVNFAKFVIYANQVPKIKDSTFAFWERVIAIEFPHTFTKEDAKKDHYKTLIAQDTLAGLLNWALVGLKRLQENAWEFTESQTQIEARGNMRRQAQPVKMFIDEWTKFDNHSDIPKARLFDAFKIYCDVHGLLIPDEGEFTRELKRNVNVDQKRLNMEDWDISGRVLSWRGLKLNNDIDMVFRDIEREEEANSKIEPENERNIKIKIQTLPDYMMCQTCQTCHTFSLLRKHIGEKSVVLENRTQIPLYVKVTENTPDFPDRSDISKNEDGDCCIGRIGNAIEQASKKKEEELKETEKKELKEEQKTTAPQTKTTPLMCVCGKKFDTQEVLQIHQSKCKDFQAKQDKEAREEIKGSE